MTETLTDLFGATFTLTAVTTVHGTTAFELRDDRGELISCCCTREETLEDAASIGIIF